MSTEWAAERVGGRCCWWLLCGCLRANSTDFVILQLWLCHLCHTVSLFSISCRTIWVIRFPGGLELGHFPCLLLRVIQSLGRGCRKSCCFFWVCSPPVFSFYVWISPCCKSDTPGDVTLISGSSGKGLEMMFPLRFLANMCWRIAFKDLIVFELSFISSVGQPRYFRMPCAGDCGTVTLTCLQLCW